MTEVTTLMVPLDQVVAWIKANPCSVCDGTRDDCDEMADALAEHFRSAHVMKPKCQATKVRRDGVRDYCALPKGHDGMHIDNWNSVSWPNENCPECAERSR